MLCCTIKRLSDTIQTCLWLEEIEALRLNPLCLISHMYIHSLRINSKTLSITKKSIHPSIGCSFLLLWLCKLCRCYFSATVGCKKTSVSILDSPHHVFILSWKDALPSLPVLFAVFNQVLQIRALIYKDASAIVALWVLCLHLQPDWRFYSPISAAFTALFRSF